MRASLQRKAVAQSNLPEYIKGNPEALKKWSDNFDQRRKMANGMAVMGIGVGLCSVAYGCITGLEMMRIIKL